MAWMYLLIAGIFEMGWSIGLKFTHGFTQLIPSVLTVLGMVLSFFFLAHAVKTLPLGVAYAAWTGMGIIGTSLATIFLFHEPMSPMQMGCVVLIAAGIIGMRLSA